MSSYGIWWEKRWSAKDVRETLMEESNEDALPGIALDTKFSFKTHL